MATKKCLTKQFFFTPHFSTCFWIRDPGSEIRDPGSGMGKNQDPGSGINIPDPQHWWVCSWLEAGGSKVVLTPVSVSSQVKQNSSPQQLKRFGSRLCCPNYGQNPEYINPDPQNWTRLKYILKKRTKTCFHWRLRIRILIILESWDRIRIRVKSWIPIRFKAKI